MSPTSSDGPAAGAPLAANVSSGSVPSGTASSGLAPSGAASAGSAAPLRVLVSGCLGKMGSTICAAIEEAADLQLVGGFDPHVARAAGEGVHGEGGHGGGAPAALAPNVVVQGVAVAPAFSDLVLALEACKPQVLVDFSLPGAAVANLELALQRGVDCVLGTTGIPQSELERLAAGAPKGTALFFAPNYTTGAVLMMAAARLAARYFEDAEIIEYHHNNKKDAPSGTAIATARQIAAERLAASVASGAPGTETELPAFPGARGSALHSEGQQNDTVRLHSVRSNGFMASQEVIFGSPGQTLTIRHDSFDRSSYMPGVLLAIRRVGSLTGLHIGLEELMDL